MIPFLLLFLGLAQVDPAPRSVGNPCAEGRISHVFVDNHSIFDPASMPEEGWLRPAYRLANALHMQTRAEFIESQLLLGEGDCFDPELVRESARILRDFRFIAGADAYGVRQPDGSMHVVVDTRDEWTTKFSLDLRFDEGLRFEGASVVEENLAGRGIAAGVVYRHRDEQRDLSVGIEVPRIRGTNWDGRVSAGATRVGELFEQKVVYPFRGERDARALRQEVTHRRDLFNYVVPANGESTHLVVPLQEERVSLALAQRFGLPGDLLVLGGGASWERVGTGDARQVEAVVRGDFGNRRPADAALARSLEPQLGNRQAFRLSLLAGLRRISYRSVRGFDAVAGIQDLPIGREVLFSVGPSLGPTGPGRPSDVHTRLDLFRGGELGSALAFARVSTEVRRESGGAWRDLLTEGRALAYWQIERLGSPTLVLRATGHAGRGTRSPFQLVLGGPEGVRGYSDTAFPGGRRLVASGEGRWHLPGPFSELLDLGVTAFGDVGRMWPGDAPLGVDSGWRAALGGGFRVGFPTGSSSVIRVDVSVPVDGGAPRSPLLRISAREWIGLMDDARNLQLLRSRRSGLDSDFTGVASDQRPPG